MKKLLLISLVAASFGLTASAMAQAAGPVGVPPTSTAPVKQKGHQGGEMKMNEELLAKLNLTDDQKTKLKAHQDEMKTKMDGLKADSKAAKGDATKKEALKQQMDALRKENRAFMKELLTKDQLKQLAKLRKEAAAEKAKPGTPTTPPPTPTKP